MIHCEFRFTSETEDCVSEQTAEGFLNTLQLYKQGYLVINKASIDGVSLDVDHLLEVLI